MTKLKGAAILGALMIAGLTLLSSLPASGGTAFKALWLAAIIASGLIVFAVAALLAGGPEVQGVRKLIAEKMKRRTE